MNLMRKIQVGTMLVVLAASVPVQGAAGGGQLSNEWRQMLRDLPEEFDLKKRICGLEQRLVQDISPEEANRAIETLTRHLQTKQTTSQKNLHKGTKRERKVKAERHQAIDRADQALVGLIAAYRAGQLQKAPEGPSLGERMRGAFSAWRLSVSEKLSPLFDDDSEESVPHQQFQPVSLHRKAVVAAATAAEQQRATSPDTSPDIPVVEMDEVLKPLPAAASLAEVAALTVDDGSSEGPEETGAFASVLAGSAHYADQQEISGSGAVPVVDQVVDQAVQNVTAGLVAAVEAAVGGSVMSADITPHQIMHGDPSLDGKGVSDSAEMQKDALTGEPVQQRVGGDVAPPTSPVVDPVEPDAANIAPLALAAGSDKAAGEAAIPVPVSVEDEKKSGEDSKKEEVAQNAAASEVAVASTGWGWWWPWGSSATQVASSLPAGAAPQSAQAGQVTSQSDIPTTEVNFLEGADSAVVLGDGPAAPALETPPTVSAAEQAGAWTQEQAREKLKDAPQQQEESLLPDPRTVDEDVASVTKDEALLAQVYNSAAQARAKQEAAEEQATAGWFSGWSLFSSSKKTVAPPAVVPQDSLLAHDPAEQRPAMLADAPDGEGEEMVVFGVSNALMPAVGPATPGTGE